MGVKGVGMKGVAVVSEGAEGCKCWSCRVIQYIECKLMGICFMLDIFVIYCDCFSYYDLIVG